MLKVSGEALSGTSGFGIDPEVVQTIAREVAEASLAGVQVAVVVGGVIPPKDYAFLREKGAKAIFGPGTPVPKAAREVLQAIRSGRG